ncbi:glycoside hydrolase family 2 TIM barrel-domain containing protein [Allokutzneria multivorans]|uniref:Glycoside hydrolase family 2 TIM barrel-domain containing protein n=1 Tax=Allokutzneria multivorans TaxID=1142134 RepID=A0ABP7SAQ6_9PSEU
MDELHPRPRMVREHWIDLCGPWRFGYDDADQGLAERWQDGETGFDRDILVPYPPESERSGVHDPSPHTIVWYRRTFALSELGEDFAGKRLLLHLGAVDYHARVWVNGALVAEHVGGHTPISADITDALDRDADEQVIVVRAQDEAEDPTQTRGKQDWLPEPHAIWYHRTTGIWQPVWLEPVPANHLSEIQWTPDLTQARVRLEAVVTGPPATSLYLRVRLWSGAQLLAEESHRVLDQVSVRDIAIPAARHGQHLHALMWSPESPNLIDAELTLLDADGVVVDEVHSYFGYRSVDTADGRFLLNGRPYFLRMVLEQGYWPQSHLAAPDGEALRREVELIKELGFNGARIHQKVEDPRFLYWCDRLGLLVWGEMADAYQFSTATVERMTREWIEVLRRDRSHPCVVAWVPLNESWGVPQIAEREDQRHFATALYHLTKSIDPTRPVIANDGWEHTVSDIWGVHDYAPSGDSLRERYSDPESIKRALGEGRPGGLRVLLDDRLNEGQPVMLTEFGGLSYVPAKGENWFGYSTVDSPEALLERLTDLVGALLASDRLAGFCYTQLTDTEQETNGLLTAAREPKVDPALVRALLNRPARAIPTEEVSAHRAEAERAARGDSA